MADPLAQPLLLPCGVSLPNRLCKAAMTEGLADGLNRATPELCNLYRAWSKGGSGLLITGNVPVDRRYPERPGNVCIDGRQDEEQLARLRAFAQAGTVSGNQCWVQLSHAGRQVSVLVNKVGLGPSAVESKNVGGRRSLLPSWPPEEITPEGIADVVRRFAEAAGICKEVGFTGVQIHGAHGYLLSSFLNPRANKRTDAYGGSVENRARFLLDVVAAIRQKVGPGFPVAVKLNTSDFQQGGLSVEDAVQVGHLLDEAGVDLLELSGGNYENPALLGSFDLLATSTQLREAYFVEFAKAFREVVKKTPLMVTGGMRSRASMEQALASGNVDVIGLGRPLCGMPDAPRRLLDRSISAMPRYENELSLPAALSWVQYFQMGRIVRTFAIQQWCYRMEILMGQGLRPETDGAHIGPLSALIFMDSHEAAAAKKLQGLSCIGTVHNAKRKMLLVYAIIVLALAAAGGRMWRGASRL